ncbi:MAG: hypothetical protein D6718_03765 [Acidobacteria bacterium]|nr:MAG: hypothetical protein D6718_03765 [Acidobacteriota bacterium]
MVLNAQRRLAPLAGLALVNGSVRLILLRWALLVVSGSAAVLLAAPPLAAAARRPFFTEPAGPLPAGHLARLAIAAGPGLGAAAGAAALLALAGHWLLVPGAIAWLDRVRRGGRPRGVVRFVVEAGTPRLWAMARITLLAVALAAAGLAAIRLGFHRLDVAAERGAWDSAARAVLLPRLRWLAGLLWLALVGAFAFWCRVVMVADGRARVRSVMLLVPRIWVRIPFSAPVLFVAVTVLVQAGAGAYLLAWRQSAPRSVSGLAAWSAGALAVLLLQAGAWHWLLRSALVAYGNPRLAPLRARPDRPWYLFRRLARRPVPPPTRSVVAAVAAPEPAEGNGPEP